MALWGAVCAMRGVGCARLWRAGEGAGAAESGAERGEGSRERQGQRDSIADGTALRNTVGEEVAATFGDTEDLSPRALCLCRYAP